MLDLSDQVAISAVVSFLMERLKGSDKFPLLSHNTDALNRAVSWVINLAVQFGVGFAWDGSLMAGGTLTITVPSIWTVYELGKGLAVQEGVYQKFFKRDPPKPVDPPPIRWDTPPVEVPTTAKP